MCIPDPIELMEGRFGSNAIEFDREPPTSEVPDEISVDLIEI